MSENYPDYEGSDTTEERLAKCIEFELKKGGNALAAARAILRDIALGYIDLTESMPVDRER